MLIFKLENTDLRSPHNWNITVDRDGEYTHYFGLEQFAKGWFMLTDGPLHEQRAGRTVHWQRNFTHSDPADVLSYAVKFLRQKLG